MSYLIRTMKRLGYRVVVISLLASGLPGYHRRKVTEIDALEKHVYLETLNFERKLLRRLSGIINLIILCRFLLSNLKKNDMLLLYHYHLFSIPVRLAKFLIRYRLVLEIEEIHYKEARTVWDVRLEKTERALIGAADAYLAINERVRSEYCLPKPTVISYGAFCVPPRSTERYDDGKIHLVYAGIINASHGAHTAIKTMQYLDDAYRLHIYGFGSDKDIVNLKRLIADINRYIGCERIFYYGVKSGIDFDTCLQRCHIGLNFNISLHPDSGQYAFPSKIPAYLGHGLNVLTYRIPSVEQSALAPFVQFYDRDAPESIACAIKSARLDDYESLTESLEGFDRGFSEALGKLLEEVKKV